MPKIRGVHPDIWTDEDFVELSPFARLLWIGMWNYACDNGHIADKSKQIKMRLLPTDDVNAAELLRELERNGRIERSGGWITVPNFTKRQRPDKRYFITCEAPGCTKPGDPERETRGGHAGKGDISTPHSMGPLGDGEVMVKDGDGDKSRELALTEAPREDVDRICEHLAGLVAANGSKAPTITARWRDSARLMLDRDGRTEQEIHGAIDWCQADEFWRGNILSLPKLREKYDQLRLQAQRRSGGTSRNEEWRSMQERQMARAEAREREMGLR